MNDSEEKAIWKIVSELKLNTDGLVQVAEASSIAMTKIYERVKNIERALSIGKDSDHGV